MGVRAYIVDDEPAIGRLLQSMLAVAGIDSVVENDSFKAAARIQVDKFNVVFLDIHMPGLNGLELTRIQRAGGANARTPIVMITGDENSDVFREAYRAGITCFLYKPFNMRSVRSALSLLKNPMGAYMHSSSANPPESPLPEPG